MFGDTAVNRLLIILVALLLLPLLNSVTTVVETASCESQGSLGTLQPFWNITRGGPRADEGWGVAVDAVHDVYFAGFNRIASATADVFLCKLSPSSVELWNASWGGSFDDEAFVVTAADEYVYVGGRTFTNFSLASANMFILKFSASNGSLVWSRVWDGGFGYDEVDGLRVYGGSLYVTGWTTGAATQNDIAVLRYDLNGTLLWARSWGTPGWDEANGHIGIDENYVYVVGRYNASNMVVGGDAVLAAFNRTDGSYAWHTTWGGNNLDDAFGMSMDSNYIYSVGITSSFGNDLIFLLKYSKAGTLMWNATWGGSGSELTRSVGVNADSTSIYVAGSTTSYGNGDFDVVQLRFNQNGTLTLSKTWGGQLLDRSHGIAVDDPFIYIAGDTRSYAVGDEDAFLLKVDVDGGNTIPEFSLPTMVALIAAATLAYAIILAQARRRGQMRYRRAPKALSTHVKKTTRHDSRNENARKSHAQTNGDMTRFSRPQLPFFFYISKRNWRLLFQS